ncbi:glycosyltransferase involved in cell wall biosynthesis [Salinibacter ruber]|uniref:glycosyltransferase family 2 protein n=1 Tax=Salinibacter ruber TaxID=146919 RepID=UPI0021682B7B|nr:glycosyltransferase family 2 protein [Salinibacter ruber]MCS3668074.1 glycosyltransferase involved in cell wall biosynthesis [Salinibacter ruber]
MSEANSRVTVSVVTVAYNADCVIRETIESVLAQDYPAVEYVVVDGASTDQTWQIVQEYADAIDVAVREPDDGIYDAMNKGAELASGEWVIYMNAGDTFASDRVLSELRESLASTADVILGGVEKVLVDEYETRRFREFPGNVADLWKRMPTSHQSVLVRREHVLEYSFDTSYRWCADQDQLLRLQAADKNFETIDKVISVFDCQSDETRSGDLYIRERWDLSEGHASNLKRYAQFGYEWIHCHLWGPVVSRIRSLLPGSWVLTIRELRGTAGDMG